MRLEDVTQRKRITVPEDEGEAVQTRGCLTSAATGRAVCTGALGDGECSEALRASWMDANGGIKVGLGSAHPESHGIALSDLASVGRQDMQANDFLLQCSI